MEFRILGPLEVVSDSQALDAGGAKQRALLALLLLHANSVVSTDRLIDALWEDDPPESAQGPPSARLRLTEASGQGTSADEGPRLPPPRPPGRHFSRARSTARH
jgi:Transcriptional regulatory protein, C terminal